MSAIYTHFTEDYNSFIIEYLDILHRLIKQKSLNIDLKLPNSNLTTLKDLQDIIEYIFNGRLDTIIYLTAYKEIFNNNRLKNNSKVLLKKLSPFQVMNFAQVIIYKTLPCPKNEFCLYKPREIAPSNQYKDEELECPYYHHDKDRRRLPITKYIEEEFIYKANYDKSKCDPNPDKFSKNYFESMFHPIYYKLFQCKRIHCNNTFFCPFFHTKVEKTTWDETFLIYIRKSRDVYTKEKKEQTNDDMLMNYKNIQDEYINRFNVITIDRKNKLYSLPQSQMLDRISTNSSIHSSPSSKKGLSPEPEKSLMENNYFDKTKKIDLQMESGIFEQQFEKISSKESNSNQQLGIQSFEDITERNQNYFGNKNETSKGGFSLFGDYPSIFYDKEGINIDKNLESNSNKADKLALSQYFDWQIIKNINNLKLHQQKKQNLKNKVVDDLYNIHIDKFLILSSFQN